MSDLGRAVSNYVAGLVMMFTIGGVVVGVVLAFAFAVPWLWAFAAAHVSIH